MTTSSSTIAPPAQPADVEANLNYLHGTQDALGLDHDQSVTMLNYLLGGLSARVPAAVWAEAVQSAAAPFATAGAAVAQ